MPMVPTRHLVVRGPYAYSRNPVVLRATLYYLGLAVWLESAAFLALTGLFFLVAVRYAKVIEEPELEARFGEAYRRYKGSTPFLIPRPRRRPRER